MRPHITIIVATHNRSVMLARLLVSLSALDYPSWDVIVVDDGSTDDTAAVAAHFRREGLALTYLRQRWQKMGAARNLGLAHAEGEIAAFTDDDCVVDPNWLHAVADAFATHPDALGVQGKTVTDRSAMTPFTRQVEQLEGGQPYRTCNIAYRAAVLRDLGGFDPHLIRGEDVLMGARVLERGPIVFAPDAVVCPPPRPKEWAGRRAWRTLLESETHFNAPTHATPRPGRSSSRCSAPNTSSRAGFSCLYDATGAGTTRTSGASRCHMPGTSRSWHARSWLSSRCSHISCAAGVPARHWRKPRAKRRPSRSREFRSNLTHHRSSASWCPPATVPTSFRGCWPRWRRRIIRTPRW